MIKDKIAENATLKWQESRKITGKVENIGRAGGHAGQTGMHTPPSDSFGPLTTETDCLLIARAVCKIKLIR